MNSTKVSLRWLAAEAAAEKLFQFLLFFRKINLRKTLLRRFCLWQFIYTCVLVLMATGSKSLVLISVLIVVVAFRVVQHPRWALANGAVQVTVGRWMVLSCLVPWPWRGQPGKGHGSWWQVVPLALHHCRRGLRHCWHRTVVVNDWGGHRHWSRGERRQHAHLVWNLKTGSRSTHWLVLDLPERENVILAI